jgi:CopG antitoxin of type II toxin-antitoxin system
MDENKSTISQASTLADMGVFWDTHDFTDYDTEAPDISVTFRRSIAIEFKLFEAIEHAAQARGVSAETLVNLWLQQKLDEEKQNIAA